MAILQFEYLPNSKKNVLFKTTIFEFRPNFASLNYAIIPNLSGIARNLEFLSSSLACAKKILFHGLHILLTLLCYSELCFGVFK